MKTLYLVRHGKSSWKDLSLKDFDRPLNKRGKKDAPFMAELLKEKGIRPDIIISSPAKRARKTAEEFAKALKVGNIVFDEKIYYEDESDLLKIIDKAAKKHDTVFIFGHNPTLTDTANSLIEEEKIDNIPTTGIAIINLESKKLIGFEYPKKYRQD